MLGTVGYVNPELFAKLGDGWVPWCGHRVFGDAGAFKFSEDGVH